MQFPGFMQLLLFPWAGLGWWEGDTRPGREGSRGAGVWKCPCPWGKGRLFSSAFLLLLPNSPLPSPQAPRDVWYEAEKVWLIQQDGFTLGNSPSSALDETGREQSGLWVLCPALPRCWLCPLGLSPGHSRPCPGLPHPGTLTSLSFSHTAEARRGDPGAASGEGEGAPGRGWHCHRGGRGQRAEGEPRPQCHIPQPGLEQGRQPRCRTVPGHDDASPAITPGWLCPAVGVAPGLAQPCRDSRAPGMSLPLFPQTNPPSLDQAEDLAALISLNECSVINTLRQRFRARLPCTYAGPNLVAIATGPAPASGAGKVREGTWDSGISRGKRPPTLLGTVAKGAGLGGAGRWHRGTVTVRGQPGPGMLRGHLRPGLLWGHLGPRLLWGLLGPVIFWGYLELGILWGRLGFGMLWRHSRCFGRGML